MKLKLLLLATSSLIYTNAQNAESIAGEAQSKNPSHHGDTKHAATNFETIEATTAIIHEKLVMGLRSEFDFLRNSITGGVDGEGFVREGIVFCGSGETDTNGKLTTIPSYFSQTLTQGLTVEDGWGGAQALNIAESDVCAGNPCEEGSFVHTLVNRIRSAGYHITHADVCSAATSTAWNNVPIQTCQLNGYKDGTTDLTTRSFKAKTTGYLAQKITCYKMSKEKCTETGVTNCIWTSQNTCVASNTFLNTLATTAATSTIAVDTTDASSAASLNEIRRATTYEDTLGQGITDNVFVTGVEVAWSGITPKNNCKSLRQYVAALNGLAQINAFRDKGILEGNEIWGALIKKLMKNYKGISILLNDFHAESVKMFPLIESEDMDNCAMGTAEHKMGESGSEKTPSCVKSDYATVADIDDLSAYKQTVLRNNCFCRDGSGFANADAPYLEFDQTKITNKCSDLSSPANAGAFADVRKYLCEGRISKDVTDWKSFLVNLEPSAHKIITFGGTNKAARAATIITKLKDTMNIIGTDTFDIECGRLISTDKDDLTSNKGGNCVPFRKLNDVLYKLEYMTSGTDVFLLSGDIQECNDATILCPSNFPTLEKFDNLNTAMVDINSFNNRDIDKEQIYEASVNVDIAEGLKRSVRNDNEVAWLALKDELTSMSTDRIIYDMSEAVAKNFMRITTTDSNDNAVDAADDDGASNAKTQVPTNGV
tara:strand:+ start:14009 stop:16144 length:2136 start_codon:yes stop_codon:yes gene_type:complete